MTVNGRAPTAARVAAGAAACDVLNLVLGPLDLNLLGLEIYLDREDPGQTRIITGGG